MTIKHCLRVQFSLYLLKMFQFVVNAIYLFTFQIMAGDGWRIYHFNWNMVDDIFESAQKRSELRIEENNNLKIKKSKKVML